jgi:menaquinone-9 beta-reductase
VRRGSDDGASSSSAIRRRSRTYAAVGRAGRDRADAFRRWGDTTDNTSALGAAGLSAVNLRQPGRLTTTADAAVPSISVSVPASTEIAIIGAGPGGSAAAIALARAGRTVTLIDRASFPRDKCCGDGLTTGALRRLEALGLDPSTIPSWTWVDDVQIAPPNGKRRTFPLPREMGHFAAVATRMELDAALVRLAVDAGATLHESTTLTGIRQSANGIDLAVTGPNGESSFTAERVIAADGMWSPTRKLLGGGSGRESTSDKPYLGEWHGYRQYVSNVHTAASRDLCVWFDRDIVPGYLWCFPLADGRVNLGFGVERRPELKTKEMKGLWATLLERPYLREVLGSNPVFEETPKAWPIPCAPTDATAAVGRVLFVGDAVRACDVLTGEGIGQALQTGTMAANAILRTPTFADAARDYEHELRSHLGPDHRMATALERMMRSKAVANGAVAISGSTDWTRRNFARWLFEDYARGIALTPKRWHRGLMSGPGAYRTR